ncbi:MULTISPECIES: MerR family transcriptional regulator [Kribbella]|nr:MULTISPECIES: MerR family transcriptional regulator [Kribbella]
MAAASRGETPPAVWPVGRVAAMLGVPAVTIRSWEARYDIAPPTRSPGRHRRYSSEDIARLRRMQRLIAAGTPAADAARLSAIEPDQSDAQPELPAAEQVAALLADLESFRIDEAGAKLDGCLRQRGLQPAWEDVVAPALRRLQDRFQDTADCIDLETLLADEAARAVDRYAGGRRLGEAADSPVLLACCPGERHWLPLKVLQGVLLERGTPAVLLAPDLPPDAVLRAARRASPRAIVLWSLTPRPAQAILRRRLIARGEQTVAAGLGWSPKVDPLTHLDDAVHLLSRL